MPDLFSQMQLKIGGSKVDRSVMQDIKEVVVDTSLHLPDMFTIYLYDTNLKWIDSPAWDIGKSVEISAKEEGSSQATVLLSEGEITAIEPDLGINQGVNLIIRGYDKSHRLHRGKKTRTFVQMSDRDIAQKIAAECGLSARCDATNQIYEHVFQDSQTDMEFLQERAQHVGFFCFVKDGALHFRSQPRQGGQPLLEWSRNLLSFQARFTTAEQVGKAQVYGWDTKQKKAIKGEASSPKGTPLVKNTTHGGNTADSAFGLKTQEVVVDHPVWSQGEADVLAQSVLDEKCHALFFAEGTCDGNPEVRAGSEVKIKGIGTRFSGTYLVTRAIHRYDQSGYNTHFEVGGRRANTISDLLHSKSQLRSGVVIGIVTNTKDPDNLARVKVKYPTLSDQLESNWARLVSPTAGPGRGFLFIPEVNDEVLVAFEYGDINKPFIVGSLWNGKDKPPQTDGKPVGEDGTISRRTIQSRTGHRITLDDTSNGEKITITDKSGHKVILDSAAGKEKLEIVDKTGKNKVTMDSVQNSVSIESAMKLTLKAQTIQIEGTSMNIKSQSTMNIESAMTTIKSQATMNIEGGLTTVKANTGILTLQGGPIVKIN